MHIKRSKEGVRFFGGQGMWTASDAWGFLQDIYQWTGAGTFLLIPLNAGSLSVSAPSYARFFLACIMVSHSHLLASFPH